MSFDQYEPADDTLESVAKIAPWIGKTERQTFYMLESGQLPGYKLGGKWHMRKSRYRRFIEELEAAAIGATAA
jgi:hypothetical protein